MEFKKIIISLVATLGLSFVGISSVDAATTMESTDGIYHSNYRAVPIYSDPALTQNTGRTLNTSVDAWQTFQVTVNEAGQNMAVDLGGNQWVDISVKPTTNEVVAGSYIFKEAFSGGAPIQLYSDPNLTKPSQKLDTSISEWTITKVNFINQSEMIYSVDLGNNQWASIDPLYLLPKLVRVDANNTLVNANGVRTGSVINTDISYQTFGIRSINQQVFLNLGNDNQWIEANQTLPALI